MLIQNLLDNALGADSNLLDSSIGAIIWWNTSMVLYWTDIMTSFWNIRMDEAVT